MNNRGYLMLLLIFVVALLMTIMPIPEWVRPLRPQWVTLTLIYWCIALPHRVGVGSGFVLGTILDVLTGTLLGQHALGLSLVAYLAVQLHARIRVFPLTQQALAVWPLLMVEHLFSLWIMGAIGQTTPGLIYWIVPVIGAGLWPWVYIILRGLRRRFKIT